MQETGYVVVSELVRITLSVIGVEILCIVGLYACAIFQADRARNKKFGVDFRNCRCPRKNAMHARYKDRPEKSTNGVGMVTPPHRCNCRSVAFQ